MCLAISCALVAEYRIFAVFFTPVASQITDPRDPEKRGVSPQENHLPFCPVLPAEDGHLAAGTKQTFASASPDFQIRTESACFVKVSSAARF